MAESKQGWVYALEHPCWRVVGMMKIGITARDPAKRLSEIRSSSGLIAPGFVSYCAWVSDRAAVERAIKDRVLRHRRVRRKRELYRVTPEEACAAIQRAAEGVESREWACAPRPHLRPPIRIAAPPRRRFVRWRLRQELRALAMCLATLALAVWLAG